VITLDQALGVLLASALLIVVPGPSVLFVVGRALAHGRRVAAVTAAGNALGTLTVVACIALGLGPLLETSSLAYDVVRFAGAAYLVWLGIAAVRSASKGTEARLPSDPSAVRPTAALPALRAGALVGLTNPKVFVVLASVLPQFVDPSANVPAQLMLLGLVPVALGLVTDTAWALAAGTARAWFAQSPRRLLTFSRAGGAAMIGLGVSMAASGGK
jgi:threonine/homoserine/homoserine lactone efflux protein